MVVSFSPNSENIKDSNRKEYLDEQDKSYIAEKKLTKDNNSLYNAKVAEFKQGSKNNKPKECKQCKEFNQLVDEKDEIIKSLQDQLKNKDFDLSEEMWIKHSRFLANILMQIDLLTSNFKKYNMHEGILIVSISIILDQCRNYLQIGLNGDTEALKNQRNK